MKIIILAGGTGSRLWPMTYPPKQFSPLFGTETLYQKTLNRFLTYYSADDFVIVTNALLYELALEQSPPKLKSRVVVEPKSQNTAFALLYALQWLKEHDELDDEFLVAPSDHFISPEEKFLKAIETGRERAVGHLLFGIAPTRPHSGYGYILADLTQSLPAVKQFIEKPPISVAEKLLDLEGCLWNSGIFLFQTERFFNDLDQMSLDNVPPLSIDKAFLEHFQDLCVLPLSISWSDLGSWESVYEAFAKDSNNNVVIGKATTHNTKNSLIVSQSHSMRIDGVENMCIIETEEGLLVRQRQEHSSMSLSSSFPSP